MTRSSRWLTLIETFKIRTRDRRIVPLIYNAPQRHVWSLVREKIDRYEPIRLIILKARREGISTQIESWLMTMIAAGDLVNALVTAHQAKASLRVWDMSKRFVKTSPLLSSLATIGNNTITIGRSTLEVATAGNPESERSGDLTAWHASEAAFYKFPEVMTATMQTLPPPGVFSIGVIESTAKGKVGPGAVFYREWLRAVEGDSEWVPIFLGWQDYEGNRLPGVRVEDLNDEEKALRERFELSDAQLAWRRWTIKNKTGGSVIKFHGEYPATAEEAFIQSGLPFFGSEELLPLDRDVRKGISGILEPDGSFRERAGGYLEVFKQPEPGHEYVIGADSSMGIEDDDEDGSSKKSHSRSAAEIIDMETLEQVAEYDAVTAPHIMARHLASMGHLYNNALIAPEVQGSGGGGGREIIVYLRDLEYWNLHRWRQVDRVERDAGQLYGWDTNQRTRPRMLARIREVVMERSAVIHSRRLLNQLASFGENDSGRMEALAGHDDLLFAWGIALMSRSENYFKVTANMEAPPLEPDWNALGLRVLRPEDPQARLRRLMAMQDRGTEEKSFLEL